MDIDLRTASFDDWLAHIFDHPARRLGQDAWYHDVEIRLLVDPVRQVEFLTRLATESACLESRFSPLQIDQGFWCVLGCAGCDDFIDHLWSEDVPWR